MMSASASRAAQVAQAFSRAALTYDAVADVQHETARRLLALAKPHLGFAAEDDPAAALDLGCGTGRVSCTLFVDSPFVWTLSDISSGMLQQARAHIDASGLGWHTAIADAESLPFADEHFAFIFSNYCLQWTALPASLREIARCLKRGGVAAICLPLHGTLQELSAAWRSVDNAPHINTFIDHAHMCHLLGEQGLHILHADSIQHVTFYPDVLTILRALRTMGAHTVQQRTETPRLFKRDLRILDAQYPGAGEGGYPVSWVSGFYLVSRS